MRYLGRRTVTSEMSHGRLKQFLNYYPNLPSSMDGYRQYQWQDERKIKMQSYLYTTTSHCIL